MSNFLDIEQRIARAAERYSAAWEQLPPEQSQVATKIAVLVEIAGGRGAATEMTGIKGTTLDNYRKGQTTPNFLDLQKLLRAAGQPLGYLDPSCGAGDWVATMRLFDEAMAADREIEQGAVGPDLEPVVDEPRQPPAFNGAVYRAVKRMVRDSYRETGVRLSEDALDDEIEVYCNAVLASLLDPDDREEIDLQVAIQRHRLKRQLLTARNEPGSGKRGA